MTSRSGFDKGQAMRFETTTIPGLFAIRLDRHIDARGSFARLFCKQEFAAAGLETVFVQESLSVSRVGGTLRGMHFQRTPDEEVKFVRCIRGAIYDVVADLRPDSPTYRRWQAFELSADGDLAVYIPKGCAHGFQTLVDDVEILYQMTTPYVPAAADGFRFDDNAIGITWPLPVTVIAEKDLSWPAIGF
jgi:dTDP-4-dehydrorhamnose 3,5-epimerase